MRRTGLVLAACASVLLVTLLPTPCDAKPEIREAFFATYPHAVGTQLDSLPTKPHHCAVCHWNAEGGGPRNPYGARVHTSFQGGYTYEEGVVRAENYDSDTDGHLNVVEIADLVNYTNTPTFPGLFLGNYLDVFNITHSELEPYLTPSAEADTIPPDVTVNSPNGGESADAHSYYPISYTATDSRGRGLLFVNIYMSDDGGATWMFVAKQQPPATGYSWFVPNRPGGQTRIRVEAYDDVGNVGHDDSDSDFTIAPRPAGYVPTTMRDVDMPGTQPHEGAILEDPDLVCGECHGSYDTAVEPWHNWRGSMMSQAARDPFFYACMAVAEQDAPGAGDLCIRCHSPGGWQEGRSVDTGGNLLNVKDRHGIQCDFCHRAVDYDYIPGVSPIEDFDILQEISPLPLQYANGQFIMDASQAKRGPYSDATANHANIESPFHRSSAVCGTCHDVSSPVFDEVAPRDYAPNAFDTEHPTMDLRDMFPIERTYSEWAQSEYASTGVFAPQFAGVKPDGIVSTCQDCHMYDVGGIGCNVEGSPIRDDLALHDFTGGNTFMPDVIATFYPDEVDVFQLEDAKNRATAMLQKAVSLTVTPENWGVTVRVVNETGHKLPSGYPEGRRIWLNVKAYNGAGTKVYESGAYDYGTALLAHDEDIKVYEIHPGISPALGSALGLTPGVSFHFVLNDTIYSDNRIPPRGSTNSDLEAIQSPVVGYTYADGQYWDDTEYHLPTLTESVYVAVLYQTTYREFIEFLRDENTTNSAGQDLYNAWVAQGMAPPVIMAESTADVAVGVPEDEIVHVYGLSRNSPNPFRSSTTISYSLAEKGYASMAVYDVAGRRVRVLVDGVRDAGPNDVHWDGRNESGESVASGIYFIRFTAGGNTFTKKAAVLR